MSALAPAPGTPRTSAARCASATIPRTSVLDPFCRTPRRREPVRRRRVVLPVVGGGQSRPDDRRPGAARRRPHPRHGSVTAPAPSAPCAPVSFSHVGLTVSDFNAAVRFYWEHLRLPARGRGRHAARARARRSSASTRRRRRCKIGWIRVPGGGVLEIFAFEPSQPPARHPVEPHRPHALLVQRDATCRSGTTACRRKGVEIVSAPERSPRGHSFFFVRDFDGNLIELMDLGLHVPRAQLARARSAAGCSAAACTGSTTSPA